MKFMNFGLDLQPTIDLIETPMGIMALLNNLCWLPYATDKKFVEKLLKSYSGHPNFTETDLRGVADFAVIHYAGGADYSATQWPMKNMDTLNENIVKLLKSSQDPFVEIWKDEEIVVMGQQATIDATFDSLKSKCRTVSLIHKHQLCSWPLMATRTPISSVDHPQPREKGREDRGSSGIGPTVLQRCPGRHPHLQPGFPQPHSLPRIPRALRTADPQRHPQRLHG